MTQQNYAARRGYGSGIQNKTGGASPHKLTALLYSEIVKCLKDALVYIAQIEQYRAIADRLMENRENTFGPANQSAIIKRAKVMREVNRLTAIKGDALTKVNNITAHLRNTLNDSAYPELCSDLRKLYAFIEYKSTCCIIHNDEQAVKDALKIATELLNSWNTIPVKYHYLTNCK
ncbi:flagellar export chaperone FliS [Photobacterium toruni]|uniref:flagellar export chaperone FliS n=1 Tax=Photobacterium toruni TaxID=1935446 RepID=UPI002110045E|nr:flagellar export chaperone FliS [Photobacterium toruni]